MGLINIFNNIRKYFIIFPLNKMPNYKSLKTYSKTEKVVNFSTLFDNKQPYDFDSSFTSESAENNDNNTDPMSIKTSTTTSKKSMKKKVDKENIIPKQTKRAPRSKKINEKSIDNEKLPNNNEEVVEKPPVLGKRKAR